MQNSRLIFCARSEEEEGGHRRGLTGVAQAVIYSYAPGKNIFLVLFGSLSFIPGPIFK